MSQLSNIFLIWFYSDVSGLYVFVLSLYQQTLSNKVRWKYAGLDHNDGASRYRHIFLVIIVHANWQSLPFKLKKKIIGYHKQRAKAETMQSFCASEEGQCDRARGEKGQGKCRFHTQTGRGFIPRAFLNKREGKEEEWLVKCHSASSINTYGGAGRTS